MPSVEHSPQEWFDDAARWYAERHQGCCWCGGVNRVYRSERGDRLEYECGDCEFYVCREHATARCFMAPGNSRRCSPAKPTLPAPCEAVP